MSFGFGISVTVVVASLVLGPALAAAASLPALRRALRRPVAETLAAAATSGFGSGRLDRLVAHSGLLARTEVPSSVRMGVRNALRQKRRSAATIAQVAVAAGLAISSLALGQSVTAAISQTVGRQILTLTMAAGPTRVRVIGIDTGEINAGQIVYFPSQVLERLDATPGTGNSIWFTPASSDHAVIDRATTAAANRLDAAGYPVSTTEIYVAQAQLTAADTSILTIVQILGLVVVAITLIGLVSALGMGVIERTREVGILRCIGARARQIRRVFSAEAVLLAAVGWAFGVLIGWLIYQGLLALVARYVDLSLPQEFLPVIPLITLAGVLVLTLLVIRGPLRRATRIQPGTALRYQ